MLALAEYVAQSVELKTLNKQYDDAIQILLKDKGRKKLTSAELKQFVAAYMVEYREFLNRSMTEVAITATNHYEDQLGVAFGDDFVDSLVSDVFDLRYYGATLNQRLVTTSRVLERRLTTSNASGYVVSPFVGSDANRRLLLGMLAKIENEAARRAAEKGDIKLIRWVTSHRHSQPDICDDLASNVDQKVVSYLNENNFKENPKGLFFVDDLPDPPHPNCQCEYSMVTPNVRHTNTLVKRAANAVRGILRRIRGK